MFGIYLAAIGSVIYIISFGSIAFMRKGFLSVTVFLQFMLFGTVLSFMGFSYFWQDALGQVFAIVAIVIGVAKMFVGLSVLIAHYHINGNILLDK